LSNLLKELNIKVTTKCMGAASLDLTCIKLGYRIALASTALFKAEELFANCEPNHGCKTGKNSGCPKCRSVSLMHSSSDHFSPSFLIFVYCERVKQNLYHLPSKSTTLFEDNTYMCSSRIAIALLL